MFYYRLAIPVDAITEFYLGFSESILVSSAASTLRIFLPIQIGFDKQAR
jgi:hypothetical protein